MDDDEIDYGIKVLFQENRALRTQLASRDKMIAKMIEVGNRLAEFAGMGVHPPQAEYACIDWRWLLRKIEEEKE